MTKVIAIINQKGGVGKSTTAHALGAGLRARGFSVLLIDLDAQGNLTFSFGVEAGEASSLALLEGSPAADVILQTPQGDIIPSIPALSGADMAITQTGKEYRLREALEPLEGKYDYIIIDTPPALGILTVNALTAAQAAIIPAQADIFSLQGIGQLYGTLSAVRRYTNPQLAIQGILLTRFNTRTILGRDLADMIQETAKSLDTFVYDTHIREGVAVKEAQVQRADIFAWAPNSNAARDYDAFVTEFLERSV